MVVLYMDLIYTKSAEILDNGDWLWLYHIYSENSYALQFYFDIFRLPKGATLYFYNEEKDMILGAFTSENNHEYQHVK